ncbi:MULTISPECIES: CaiB/BaiF CoA transferase family protein [Eubacteriales]|uniref:CaiB/BaiF CoA transferase family protein n=1 Tax=Eubacteriales TaxID=186802 RepID=UPI0039911C15
MTHQPTAACCNPEEKPLSGVRVLDLTHAYSGPFCTMHLADQGAEVIKIEVPGKGDQSRNWAPFKNGSSGYFAYINRNKYGITLDLKSEKGRELFKKLVAEADVVCENFRVGTMERLGLGYEVLKEINPGLIYASISGFGLEGPLAQRPCYDIIAQAMGGMMSMTGFGDQQTKVGPAIADNYSGTYLALGIAMALYQRSKTGMGRRLDVSMVDTIFSILEAGAVEYTINGHISGPEGNRDPGISPFDSFHAKDGSFVMACGTDGFWKSLCGLMKRLDLVDDPRFVTNAKRCENYLSELKSIISAWAVNYTVDEMEEMLVGAGIPFGRILTMDQVCAQDVLRDRNMLWTVKDTGIGEEIEIPGSPIKMHGCADMAMRSAPVVGEHTDSILRDVLGMDDAQITQLHNDHVV